MKDKTPLAPHVYLFDMMAERLDKNLAEAIVEEKLSADAIVEGVRRCSGCSRPEACAAMLPQDQDLKEPYSFCQNQELFSKI